MNNCFILTLLAFLSSTLLLPFLFPFISSLFFHPLFSIPSHNVRLHSLSLFILLAFLFFQFLLPLSFLAPFLCISFSTKSSFQEIVESPQSVSFNITHMTHMHKSPNPGCQLGSPFIPGCFPYHISRHSGNPRFYGNSR